MAFTRRKGQGVIRKGDTIENPVTGERVIFRQTSPTPAASWSRSRCGCSRTASSRPSTSTRTRPRSSGSSRASSPSRSAAARSSRSRATRSWSSPGRRTGSGTRATRRAFPDRGAPGAPVRAAARDDVRPGRGRQDEPQGHAEPAPPGRDRERALRRRAAAGPARLDAAHRPRARRAARPARSATGRPTCRPRAGAGRRPRPPERRSRGEAHAQRLPVHLYLAAERAHDATPTAAPRSRRSSASTIGATSAATG